MLGMRVGFVLSGLLAVPSLCKADTTITFLDSTDTVVYQVDGNGPFPCGSTPEFCTVFFKTPAGQPQVASDATLLFNIYESDGVTLSDTLQIVATATTDSITSTFQSDVEGVPLVPFAGATPITENGTVQTAATIALTGGTDNFIVQFQSDLDPVPEPRWGVLLTLGILGTALAVKRRDRGLQ